MICCRKSFVRISEIPLRIIYRLFNMTTLWGDDRIGEAIVRDSVGPDHMS
jgi:hypothetical protein